MLSNPGLAIRASRQIRVARDEQASQIEQITVGVNVGGTLNHTSVTLFSEPAGLSQSDILAYLILGRPLDKVGKADAQLLLQAASALNMGPSPIQKLTGELKQQLGLDELSLETKTAVGQDAQSALKNTSLVLGKALSPRLYISYSVGLFSTNNLLKLKYLLTKNWSLQTETSGQSSGMDIIYTIEKD